MTPVQGVKVYSGKSLSSKIGRNQCLYWTKRYLSRKPLISALIWHSKSGRGFTRRPPRPLAVKSIFCWILWVRGGFLTSWLLWPLQKSILKIQALSGCNIKAKTKGFLLVYRLFKCKHWFLLNFELKDFPDSTSTPCTLSSFK